VVSAGLPAADAGPLDGLIPGAKRCAPVGPLDVARPAGCKRLTFRYGPLHVTSGDNLILIGPVTIEKPREDGYIVRFKPDLVRLDGTVPPIEILHLHHSVWISTAFSHPMFASGEEKSIFSIPNGYGIPNKPFNELWLLNYMLHNQTPVPDNVFITYEVDFIPAKSVPAGSIKPVEPYWLNVGAFNGANPIYNTQRGFGGTPGECAFPKENCAGFDPYGKSVPGNGQPGKPDGEVSAPPAGTVVWGVGHLHPGGLRTDVEVIRGNQKRRVFTSDAVYFDPNGPVSWDMAMETTRPNYRLEIKPGDRLALNSVYETNRASWYEGMGIVVLFIAPGDTSGPDPFTETVNPDDAAITHGHLKEASNYGGPDGRPRPYGRRIRTYGALISAYNYFPGQLGSGTIPTVARGDDFTFVNLDAGFQIFHTITACAAPCNGPTGISYPLANGPVDFDSLELGFGPPGVTAASNRMTYTLNTAALNPGAYTYFCRVHPFMRGAFAVE
jgi:plastocyanin